ncbi:MAG: hypothetical protein KGY68_04815 [Candidatus Thermoplasmatota archaeon]|nr:hypothetical protein [Candidatus Thermoplasmatota archaeon]
MEKEEIEDILDRELDGTCWRFKYWKSDDTFEFRNNGADMSKEDRDDMIDEFLDNLDENSHRPVLSGKLCIQKENGKLMKKTIEKEGKASEEGQEITEEEAKNLLKESLIRIDNDLLPTNRAVVDREEIIDIYAENLRRLKMITVNLKGEKMITLTDKGGLHFETR